jgi:arginase
MASKRRDNTSQKREEIERMKLHLIQVPYDLGREEVGMGKAPQRLLQAGADQLLAEQGFEVSVERVRREQPYRDEHSAIADVQRQLAGAVRRAMAQGKVPVVLAGTCNVSLGTLGGFEHAQTGIIWFDAHGDFNTPETTISGYFAGMPLAIVTGHCYQDLWAQVGDSTPVKDAHTLLAGVRDLDPPERKLLEHTEVTVVSTQDMKHGGLKTRFVEQLERLAARTNEIYLHVDLDVLDPEEAPGVDFRAPDGLTETELAQALHSVGERFQVKAIALTAYNPDRDSEDKTLHVGLRVLALLAGTLDGETPI